MKYMEKIEHLKKINTDAEMFAFSRLFCHDDYHDAYSDFIQFRKEYLEEHLKDA